MRPSGIDIIGDVPWGTHFCQFYETGRDLLDILVPYFKAGLENNEFCMWVTSEPLCAREARLALAAALPDLDSRIARGQIEILDYGDWYTKSGTFRSEEVLQGWVDKLNHALSAGFEGLRLTGNTFWLENSIWRDFTEYEATVDKVIGRYRMVAVCTYSLSKCGAMEILDVMSNHEFALVKQNGRWRSIQRAHHKAIEHALQKSEKRFGALFASMTEGLAIHEMVYSDGQAVDYLITEVNPAYERIVGLDRRSAEGKKASELYGTGNPPYLDVFARVASSGEPEYFETYFPPMEKHFAISVFSPEKGKFATVFSDISDRRRSEKALLESAQRLSRAQEVAHLGSWELDLTNNSLSWSDEVYRIFGLSPSEFGATYEAFLERVHPDDRAAVDAAYTESLLAGNDEYEIEHRVVRRDTGEIRIVHERCRHLRNDEGKVVRSEGMIHDITERKTAEEALRQSHEALRRSHEVLEQRVRERTAELVQAQKMEAVGLLAGGIAHDFNNMMQVVTGYAHRTLMDLPSDDPLRENIERMKEAGESAAALTHQLLAFSKKQILRLIPLDLNIVIVKMEEMLRRTLGDDVILNTRLQGDLHLIKGDPVRLQQVLMNLALNARDAMDKGGTLTIETADVTLGEIHPYGEGAVPAGPYVMLAVSDTGCGIDKETQARVFDPFFTTKPQGKGTGLGLSMVYGTVQQSGGIIRIYSVPGEGTTFKIYFPRAAASADDPKSDPAPLSACGGHETLLLVEDNDKVREFTVRELENLGYCMLEARDEQGALLAAESNGGPIHLLITDIMLPGKSGRDVSEILSVKHAGIKTLYISGYSEDHFMERGILFPAKNFIPKPFTIVQLDAKIRELLGPSSRDGRNSGNPPVLNRAMRSASGAKTEASAPRVLVVDDVPGVADSIVYILSKMGYHAKAAMDGATALDLAVKMEPDAVLLDVELPDINGYDLARQLRRSGSKRPPFIIVTSGHSLQRHAESSDFLEADEYLEKPLDFKKLKTILAAELPATGINP